MIKEKRHKYLPYLLFSLFLLITALIINLNAVNRQARVIWSQAADKNICIPEAFSKTTLTPFCTTNKNTRGELSCPYLSYQIAIGPNYICCKNILNSNPTKINTTLTPTVFKQEQKITSVKPTMVIESNVLDLNYSYEIKYDCGGLNKDPKYSNFTEVSGFWNKIHNGIPTDIDKLYFNNRYRDDENKDLNCIGISGDFSLDSSLVRASKLNPKGEQLKIPFNKWIKKLKINKTIDELKTANGLIILYFLDTENNVTRKTIGFDEIKTIELLKNDIFQAVSMTIMYYDSESTYSVFIEMGEPNNPELILGNK